MSKIIRILKEIFEFDKEIFIRAAGGTLIGVIMFQYSGLPNKHYKEPTSKTSIETKINKKTNNPIKNLEEPIITIQG